MTLGVYFICVFMPVSIAAALLEVLRTGADTSEGATFNLLRERFNERLDELDAVSYTHLALADAGDARGDEHGADQRARAEAVGTDGA